MTESTQVQSTDNNNVSLVKMEPPAPAPSATLSSTVNASSTSPTPSAALEQLHAQQQQSKPQSYTQQQQYALKWNDFQSSILTSFRHLRDEEDFVDVTLACEQKSFTAHKVVLSACSPYFRKLLKANPCDHPIVILRDVRCEDVENLLSFMYNGEVNVNHEHLPDFLKTAHLLQIRGLADVTGGSPVGHSSSAVSQAADFTNSNNNNNTRSSNNNYSNKLSQQSTPQINHNLPSPFNIPTLAAAAAVVAATAPSSSLHGSNGSSSSSNNNNSSNNLSGLPSSTSTSSTTPAIQELKASSASPSTSHHWDLADGESNRNSHLTPPPQKRIKSADLFRAQHGISPERLLLDREFPVAGQHPLTRERHRDRSRDTSREGRDSLLGQALESNNIQQLSGSQKSHGDLASLHAQSAGEDSNSSDTEPSDRGDGQHDGTMDSMNGSMDHQRSHSFPSAFLGLQGLPGLLPGPSGIGANDFAADMQQKLGKLLGTAIKEEIVNDRKDEYVSGEHASPSLQRCGDGLDDDIKKEKPDAEGVDSPAEQCQLQKNNCLLLHNNNGSKPRSTNSSPTPSARSWNDSDEEHFVDDRSSSASSAISLTVKRSRHNNESTLYRTLLWKQDQSQSHHPPHRQHYPPQHLQKPPLNEHEQQQQHQQEQQQQHRQQQQQQQQEQQQQQQQYLEELQQSAVNHQQQLTANLFMARTIALSRTRDFPELFQNTSAAAVAAAAAAAAATATASAGSGAAVTAASGSSNYMLPCPLCETPLEQCLFRQHLDRHYPRDSPVCPVIECGRRFAHPNSVRNHMRIKHTLQWAKMKAMRSSGGPFAGGPDFK